MNIYQPKPLVTVLLPVYNSRWHLREAIKSIQAQTYTNWEMLVINEYGSNDGSSDIVQNLAFVDSRIRLIQNDSRLGLANSLNYGMQLARENILHGWMRTICPMKPALKNKCTF